MSAVHTSPAASNRARALVTLVVPVRNGAAHLRESLDSMLAQTYPALEVLVLDDASTDETPRILAEYAERGVRVVTQSEQRGIYANANDGIAAARGALVGVYHADDVYEPSIVAQQVAFLEQHPDVGAVFACDVFVDASGRELGRLRLPRPVAGSRPLAYSDVLNALLTYKNSFLRCPSALVRASVYRDVGVFDQERYLNTSDLEMWLRIARRHRLAVLDEHLFRYRRGHGSSSERYHRMRTDEERFFTILDEELARDAARVATPAALRAYEGHRVEDVVMRAIAHYVLGDPRSARRLLGSVRVRVLAGARPRLRLLALALGLRAIVRLPRTPALARLFEARWHPAPASAEAGA